MFSQITQTNRKSLFKSVGQTFLLCVTLVKINKVLRKIQPFAVVLLYLAWFSIAVDYSTVSMVWTPQSTKLWKQSVTQEKEFGGIIL